MWRFSRACKDAVTVAKAKGEDPTKSTPSRETPHVPYSEPDENSNNLDNEGVPEDEVDVLHDASRLKMNGTEKFDKKDFEGALADFNAAKEIEPRCASTWKYCAEIKRALGLNQAALEDLNVVDGIQPDNLFTLATRGTVNKELKYYENALKDLDRANELDGKNAFVKTQRGVVKRSLGDFEGALVDLKDANALQSNQAFVLAQLGVVMREMGYFCEALSYLNSAHEHNASDAFIYQQRGVVRRELKDLEGALDDLNKANHIMPKDPYTWRRRGVTKRELLDYHGSLEDLNVSNGLESYNNLTLNERGVTKKVLGDFRGALEDLTMADYIKGDQAFTLKHRGSANRSLGNLVEALQDLICANQLEPNDLFTLLELGMTKRLNHDYGGALIHYNKVLEMKPNDFLIFFERGFLQRVLKDYTGALQDLNNAEKLQAELPNTNTLPIMMERCFTKYAMKDVASALEDARIARNLLGKYDQFSIMGDQLTMATTLSEGPSQNASSISEKLNSIELSTSSHHLLWIEPQNLVFLKDLGRGSYGYVQKRKWVHENKDVAVKYIMSQIGALEYEVRMLAKIQHPLVVRLIGISYINEEKIGLVIMELMEYNLQSLIDDKKQKNGLPFDLEVAVTIMKQIAEAMEYLHEQGVSHRDLKSSNVLVNSHGKDEYGREQYIVKIADFGMAKLQADNKMPYFMIANVGATYWRAPEVFKNQAYQKYSFPADVWSYGMTCYEILSGEQPFAGISCAQVYYKIIDNLRPKLPTSCPAFLQSLLMKCWSHMPQDRPTFSNINKALKLYLETLTLRDSSEFRVGDAIQPHDLQKFLTESFVK